MFAFNLRGTDQVMSTEKLNQMRLEGRMTDLTITTNGGQVTRAHRCLLVAACPSLEQQLNDVHELNWSKYSTECGLTTIQR